MDATYEDLRRRIKDPVLWTDAHGVPRYDPFKPGMVDIYTMESALIEVQCQWCGAKALVGLDFNALQVHTGRYDRPTKESPGSYQYGDFPHGWCESPLCPGVTMTTETTAIKEFWKQDKNILKGFNRRPEFEFSYEKEEE